MSRPEPGGELETEVLATLGLKEPPFAEMASDAFFFPSEQHLRALDFMRRVLCSRVSAGVVTADSGCGKSLLARYFLSTVDDRILAAHVQRIDLTPRDFLLEVLRQVGVTLEEGDRTDRRRLLELFLVHQAGAGRICLLIVENAQAMQPAVLEELRQLAMMEVDGHRIVKLLLLGKPALNYVVDAPRMEKLTHPGVPRLVIAPLTEDQVAAYIAHRLRAAGAHDPDRLIPHTLMSSVHRYTDGVPSKVNRLCAKVLMEAVAHGEEQVTQAGLDQAAEDLHMRYPQTLHFVPPPAPENEQTDTDLTEPAALVVSAPNLDTVIALGGRIVIGRSDVADVTIDSAFVSRYHALILRDGQQDLLIDLGSTNGVLVNSRRVVRHVLKHRDLIQIGPARVTYLNAAVAPQTPTDGSETVAFARKGLFSDDAHTTVFAFGRFDEAG